MRLLFSRIASTVTTASVAIKNMAQAATSSPSSVEAATSSHARLFLLSLTLGIIFAATTAALAYFVWKSGNDVNDAVKRDADSRILSAESLAKIADAKAAEANKLARELENDNLRIREDIAKTNLRAEELSKETEELRKDNSFLLDRHVKSQDRLANLAIELKGQRILIECVGDVECRNLAREIEFALKLLKCEVRLAVNPHLESTPWRGVSTWSTIKGKEGQRFSDVLGFALEETGVWVDWEANIALPPFHPPNFTPVEGLIVITILQRPDREYVERRNEDPVGRGAALFRMKNFPLK